MIEIINKPLLLHLVGYLYYWQMGINSVFKGLILITVIYLSLSLSISVGRPLTLLSVFFYLVILFTVIRITDLCYLRIFWKCVFLLTLLYSFKFRPGVFLHDYYSVKLTVGSRNLMCTTSSFSFLPLFFFLSAQFSVQYFIIPYRVLWEFRTLPDTF